MIGPQIIVVSFFWLFLAFVVLVSVSDKGISQSTTPSTENRTYVGSVETDKQEVTTNPENTQAQSEYLPPTPPQENPTYVENIEINKQEVPTNPESILSQAKDLKPQQESRKNDELIGKRSQEKRTPQGGVKLPFDADNLIAKTADKDVNKLSDRLNPPRIASITADGNVIIDQGGDRLSAGMLLDVIKQDKPIIDSDTKESLGSPETPIAVLKLVTVAPNISYATIVSGEASQLSTGQICRIKSLPPEEPQGAKSTVEQTPQGGVKLPFDK